MNRLFGLFNLPGLLVGLPFAFELLSPSALFLFKGLPFLVGFTFALSFELALSLKTLFFVFEFFLLLREDLSFTLLSLELLFAFLFFN